MIVIHQNKGWKVISQYTHGLLAGKLATELKPELKPKYWVDTLTGIIEHDDQQLNFDEDNYLTEMGTPQDFAMGRQNEEKSLEHAKRVYANAMEKSQMVALMVGKHLKTLYSKMANESKGMKKFLDRITKQQESQRSIYGIDTSDADAAYAILLFCDRVSLILCRNQIPEAGREVEINSTINDSTYYLKQTDGSISIRPWPFEKKSFELEFEYQTLTQSQFGSNTELNEALTKSEIALERIQFQEKES